MKPNIVKIGDTVTRWDNPDPVTVKSIVVERWHNPTRYDIIEEPIAIDVTRFKESRTLICWLVGVNSQDKAEYFRADQIESVA